MFNDIFETKWIELIDVTIRCIFSLFTLFFVTKMLGKKQVSQLSLFDYVIGISIGNFAAEMTINLESQFLNGILAVVLFGVFAYLVSYLTMKSIWLRRFFMGTPTILVQDGLLLKKNMKKVKFDINDLLQECRISGYFDLSQIKYAIMEVNGTVSFLPKDEYRNPTIKEMGLKTTKESLCANVVIDKKLMKQNLQNMNKDEEWLMQQLSNKGYKTLEKILLVTLDVNEKIVVYEHNNNQKIYNVLE